MGRGEGSSATATLAPRRRGASADAKPEVGEWIWGRDQGRATVRFYNHHKITQQQFELLYQLHHAGIVEAATEGEIEDTADVEEPTFVLARQAAVNIPGMTGAEASKQLRALAADGHVEMSDDAGSRGLLFKGTRDLAEYLSPTAYIPTMRNAKEQGPSLQLDAMLAMTSDNLFIEKDSNVYQGVRPCVSREPFVRQARHLAKTVLSGESKQAIALVDGGLAPSGSKQTLVMAPYQFRKGRRQEPMVGMRFVSYEDAGGTAFDWSGYDSESFFTHVVRAEDLLSACKILDDPVEAARP